MKSATFTARNSVFWTNAPIPDCFRRPFPFFQKVFWPDIISYSFPKPRKKCLLLAIFWAFGYAIARLFLARLHFLQRKEVWSNYTFLFSLNASFSIKCKHSVSSRFDSVQNPSRWIVEPVRSCDKSWGEISPPEEDRRSNCFRVCLPLPQKFQTKSLCLCPDFQPIHPKRSWTSQFQRLSLSLLFSPQLSTFPWSCFIFKQILFIIHTPPPQYNLRGVVLFTGDGQRGHFKSLVSRIADHDPNLW